MQLAMRTYHVRNLNQSFVMSHKTRSPYDYLATLTISSAASIPREASLGDGPQVPTPTHFPRLLNFCSQE